MDVVMSSSGLVQLGVVFRDEIGNVLASAIKCIFGSWISDISEALAIAFGLRLVVELSFPHIIAESNCQHLIGLLQAKETPHSPLGYVIQDCIEWSHLLNHCSWSFTKRSGNFVAPALAELDDFSYAKQEYVWIEDILMLFLLFLPLTCLCFSNDVSCFYLV
ncbi:uncharacterized protein LOC131175481 [Hevea brasiliensis]|uniref:uncharacterized protein LOC131175481 n=1 Tax=Hevea brasiliensis TaxID=3981 RepID=UPI0025F52820|nr:uncharacterized protein LOC131175481 [Hevea brasiliensis]